jgi:transcriptional regulator with XRE-family HTH domain
MADLRKRFGDLLAAHRRRRRLTQEGLAEAAGLSVDMISKIEVGATGVRFPSIERLAKALGVDPAELFTNDIPAGSMRSGAFGEISAKLANLPEADLVWVNALLDIALVREKGLPPIPKVERSLSKSGSKHERSTIAANKKSR